MEYTCSDHSHQCLYPLHFSCRLCINNTGGTADINVHNTAHIATGFEVGGILLTAINSMLLHGDDDPTSAKRGEGGIVNRNANHKCTPEKRHSLPAGVK